jgi:hypothetical protein
VLGAAACPCPLSFAAVGRGAWRRVLASLVFGGRQSPPRHHSMVRWHLRCRRGQIYSRGGRGWFIVVVFRVDPAHPLTEGRGAVCVVAFSLSTMHGVRWPHRFGDGAQASSPVRRPQRQGKQRDLSWRGGSSMGGPQRSSVAVSTLLERRPRWLLPRR